MGDSFSYMPARAEVLKKFALLLRQTFFISCTAVHPKKIIFFKLQNNAKCWHSWYWFSLLSTFNAQNLSETKVLVLCKKGKANHATNIFI